MAPPRRLVIPRSPEGSVPALGPETWTVDGPTLTGLRLVFGVASTPEAEPDRDEFHPAYTVAMPVVSAGGLDTDGIYEFDAGAQLELLQTRATRRKWAVRLELELAQTREAINCAELWVEAPWGGDGPELVQLGDERGEPQPGGGRTLTVATTPTGSVEQARALGGTFTVVLRDADPRGHAPARIESPALTIAIDLRRYEFEAEDDG